MVRNDGDSKKTVYCRSVEGRNGVGKLWKERKIGEKQI